MKHNQQNEHVEKGRETSQNIPDRGAEAAVPEPPADERAEFEKWFSKRWSETSLEWYEPSHRYYYGTYTQPAWEAWQERAKLLSKGKQGILGKGPAEDLPTPETHRQEWVASKPGEPQPERIKELVKAAEQLLAWQPNCSRGSSGDLRQNRLRAALDNLAAK